MKILLTLLACLLLPAVTFAEEVGPSLTRLPTEPGWRMCESQTAVGACIKSGKEIVFRSGKKYSWQLISETSTATTYSCQAFTAADGFDATEKAAVPGVLLTQTVEAVWFDGLLVSLWFECTTITGGNVSITAHAVELAR